MRSHRGFLRVSYRLLFLCYAHTPTVFLQGIYSYFTCIIIKTTTPHTHKNNHGAGTRGQRGSGAGAMGAGPGVRTWGTDPTANNNSLRFIYSPFHP